MHCQSSDENVLFFKYLIVLSQEYQEMYTLIKLIMHINLGKILYKMCICNVVFPKLSPRYLLYLWILLTSHAKWVKYETDNKLLVVLCLIGDAVVWVLRAENILLSTLQTLECKLHLLVSIQAEFSVEILVWYGAACSKAN